jgi:ribosome maturation protein Sdo1
MSRRVKAPNTQKRFTNIGVVHLKVGSKKFEIAVYPGKIEDWRRKV